MLVALLHLAPLIFCASTPQAIAVMGLTVALQLFSELSLSHLQLRHGLATLGVAILLVGASIVLQAGWVGRWKVAPTELISMPSLLVWVVVVVGLCKLHGVSIGLIGNSNSQKLDEIASKTVQLEASIAKLHESYHVYLEARRDVEQVQAATTLRRRREANVYVKLFPFNLEARRPQNQLSEPGRGRPKTEHKRSPIDGVEPGTKPFKIGKRALAPSLGRIEEMSSNFAPSPRGLKLGIFNHVSPTPTRPLKYVNGLTLLNDQERYEPNYFSLHGLPLKSPIENVITRLPFSAEPETQKPRPPSPRAKFQHESQEVANILANLRRLLHNPSISTLKLAIHCLKGALTTEIYTQMRPLITPDMLTTWKNIITYVAWQLYLNKGKLLNLVAGGIFFPLTVTLTSLRLSSMILRACLWVSWSTLTAPYVIAMTALASLISKAGLSG